MSGLFNRSMSREAARLRTLWFRHALGLGFRACERDWTLTAEEGAGIADCLAVYGSIGGAEFTFWLDGQGWRSIVGAALDIPKDSVAGLPETLVRAALECFFDAAVLKMEKALAMPVASERLEFDALPPPVSALPFRLDCGDGSGARGAWVVADRDPAWRPAFEKILSSLSSTDVALPDSLALEVTVEAGAVTMTTAELTGLALGDVVLSPAGGEWFLAVGRKWRFTARPKKEILVVEGNAMAETPLCPETEPTAVSIDAAEVEVKVQVGKTVLTLAQLRQLGVGQIVELSTPVESPASLIVGGKVVATGDLVDVAGRVGVRITKMAGQ